MASISSQSLPFWARIRTSASSSAWSSDWHEVGLVVALEPLVIWTAESCLDMSECHWGQRPYDYHEGWVGEWSRPGTKRCLVRRTGVDEELLTPLDSVPDEVRAVVEQERTIYRLCGDRSVTYGDGVYCPSDAFALESKLCCSALSACLLEHSVMRALCSVLSTARMALH